MATGLLEREVGYEDEEQEQEDRFYPMNAVPQGHCVIINNVHFNDSEINPDRIGSDVDANGLERLFESYLNFEVSLFNDVTQQELHDTLSRYQHKDHTGFDALIVIILSHGGTGDVIYTIDDNIIKINDIAKYFTASSCPSLSNKPKVFIIQACRGPKQNQAVPIDIVPISHSPMVHSYSSISYDGGGSSSDITTSRYIADHKDFIYAFATINDFEALRDCQDGSWFVHELVTVIRKYAHKTDFQQILTEVNRQLSSKYIHEGKMQVAAVTSSLTKKLFFSINKLFKSTNSSMSSSLVNSTFSLHSSTSGSMVLPHFSLPGNDDENVLVATPPLAPQQFAGRRPITWHTSTPARNTSPLPRRQTVGSLLHHKQRSSLEVSIPYGSPNRAGTRSPYPSPRSSIRYENRSSQGITAQGYCIVINNNSSYYEEAQLVNIKKVFADQLGFHVQIYSDLTRKGMEQLLKAVASVDHTDLYCLVVIILGQGKSKKLQLDDIVKQFSPHRSSKSLVDKPKLFFIETQMNEKHYISFRNDPFVPTIRCSFISIVNNVTSTETQASFLQYLLQTISTIEYSTSGFIFQDMVNRALKAFNMRETGFKNESLDELKNQLNLFKLRPHKDQINVHQLKDHETQQVELESQDEEIKSQSNKLNELVLALTMSSSIRNTTISVLREEQDEIMQVCKYSQVSVALRASLAISGTLGITGGSVVTDKLISKAKLKRAQAVIEVDRQLTEQVNKLFRKMDHLSLPVVGDTTLILPLDVYELVSNSIRLYKRSETEATKWFSEQLSLLQDQQEEMEQIILNLNTMSLEYVSLEH